MAALEITEFETAELETAERRFGAMGTTAHVVVEATAPGVDVDALVEQAIARLCDLERRWSRFIPTSEISRWNRCRDEAYRPSDVTWRLVRAAADASERTGGRFDPTLIDAVHAIGYDRPFNSLPSQRPKTTRRPRSLREQRQSITLDPCTGSVRSPDGFDPGGIGKGFAADLVVDELIADGADRAIVNLGGDLRIGHALEGLASMSVPIDVRIAEALPHAASVDAADGIDEIVRLDHGAIATSTTQRRRWRRGGSTKHHIVDPNTNDSAASPAMLATVIAAEAWWAEAVATALIVDPTFEPERACALVVFEDGTRRTIGDFDAYRLPRQSDSEPKLQPGVMTCSP